MYNSDLKYRSEIDGLRAIAVIAVIFFHAGYDFISGGYFGVDVFFVISGYLITSIILREIRNDSFSFISFWKKRLRRIFPALLVMINFVLVFSIFFIFRPELYNISGDAISSVFSYANFHMFFKFKDYWGNAAENSYFLHTWSLSLEEQFYLIYPGLILLLYKFKRRILLYLTILFSISFMLFIWGVRYNPNQAFFLLPYRMWELCIGGIIGIYHTQYGYFKNKFNVNVFPILGLILILISFFIKKDNTGIDLITVIPVIGSALIIAFSNSKDFVGKILSYKGFTFIGKISYSLYLWHWPLIVFSKYLYPHIYAGFEYLVVPIVLIVTVFISILSYFLVENPIRYSIYSYKFIFSFFSLSLILSFYLSSNLFDVRYKSLFNPVVFHGMYFDISPSKTINSKNKSDKQFGVICPKPEEKFKNSYCNGGIIKGKSTDSPEIVVFGDSHGSMWAKLVDEIADSIGVNRSFYTSVANIPVFNLDQIEQQNRSPGFSKEERKKYAIDFINNINIWKPKLLIISCRWTLFNSYHWEKLEELLSFLSDKSIEILILNQPPEVKLIGDKNSAQILSYLGFQPSNGFQKLPLLNNSNVDTSNKILCQYETKYSNVHVFDVNGKYKVDDYCKVTYKNEILYFDDDHLSYQGTKLLYNDMFFIIKELLHS